MSTVSQRHPLVGPSAWGMQAFPLLQWGCPVPLNRGGWGPLPQPGPSRGARTRNMAAAGDHRSRPARSGGGGVRSAVPRRARAHGACCVSYSPFLNILNNSQISAVPASVMFSV